MDTTQLLLTVVLSVTTILLIVVGLQLIFVLRDLRKTIKKVNTIIESFEHMGETLDHSFGEMKGFLGGLKTVFKLIDIFHSKKNGKSK